MSLVYGVFWRASTFDGKGEVANPFDVPTGIGASNVPLDVEVERDDAVVLALVRTEEHAKRVGVPWETLRSGSMSREYGGTFVTSGGSRVWYVVLPRNSSERV